jgi:uncharacterized cupin superfamily protein
MQQVVERLFAKQRMLVLVVVVHEEQVEVVEGELELVDEYGEVVVLVVEVVALLG